MARERSVSVKPLAIAPPLATADEPAAAAAAAGDRLPEPDQRAEPVEPRPPATAMPRTPGSATRGRRGRPRNMTSTGDTIPDAALPAAHQYMEVGKVVAPGLDEMHMARQRDAKLRDDKLAQGLSASDENARRTEGGQQLPPWRRVGGEEFERRAQLKDSFSMIWSRERGLHADPLGSKSANTSSTGTFVYTWGMGYHGQLGKKFARGEIRMCLQPNLVALPSGVSVCQVACGAFHTMVLTIDGRIFSWGEGRHGQLGYACLAKQETPLQVTEMDANCGAYIAAGRHHSAMIDRRGSLWCWGHGKQGQLGDGERPSARHAPKKLTKYKPSPKAQLKDMPPTLRFKQLACGARHTAAVSVDGQLVTFGSGKQGQLGHGMPLQDAVLPTAVEFFSSTSTGNRARFVDASATLTVVVTENDGVYCWGMADYIHSAGNGIGSMVPEDLGNAQPPPPNHIADESGKCLSKPKRVCPPELKVLQAQVGQGHILLLSKAGDVYAWGQGSEGEIGCGVKINVHVPRLVMSGKNVADITVGRYHNACVTEYGLIYSWGAGEHGQLGHAAEQCETLPRLAESMLDCVAGQIACGEQHTAVLTSGRGMQIMAGCAAWRSQEESELRIKQQMAAALPLGIGARELLSIGPTVRTYVDLFVEERERRQDGTLKGVEIKEKDKEVKIESKEKIVEEAKAALSRIRDLDSTVQGMNGPDGVGSEQAGSGGAKSEKSVDSGSEEEFDDRTLRQVGKLHGDAEIDDVSEATHQLLHVKTVTRRLKSTAQLAEEARQRAQALKAETERQETELAKAKLESWAKRAFKEMDANNDNSLTLEELGSGIAAESKLRTLPAGLQYTDGKDLFNAIDVDHDGKVTEDEFVQEVLRVCNLEDAKRLTTESGAAHVLASAEVQIHGKIKRGMPGMATSSKGKAKHRGKGKQVTPRTRTDKGAADGLDDTRLRPTPPGRIHDPKMRAGDEKILVAFFAEFQPEFATPKHVQQIIRFYAEEHARKSRISPMSSATAGGGDYRELLRTEYRRQRGVDPWEWYESVRHAQSAALADSSGQPNSTAAIKERFARSTARTADSARKQARARRVQAAQARKQTPQGQDNRSVSPDEATKKAMANVSSRKFSSPRTRAGGKIRSNSAAAPAKDDLLTPRPLDVGSAMTARTVTLTAPTGDTTVKAPVLPGVATTVTEGSGEPGASPRMTRRAKSARLVRERRTQMTRSAYHARSHTSAADRVIFKGVQDLRNKGTKAKDHWVAIFSPLGPRSDFMRQAGDILVDSRRSLAAGRGATERSTSRIVGKVSLLRSKLDKSKTVLERKREKLQSLKAEHANLVSAIASEEEALKAEHAEEARTSTLLETVHTRLMEASENHEELTSTYVYMKEHLLSMQLLQKERSDELRAAERLHGTLVALKDRSETMAAGVMHEVKGLREDNAAVRAQFQQALEQYGSVQKRSRECADETYKIVQQRARDRREREKQEEQRKHKKLGKSVGSNLMSGARQKAQMARARRCQQVLLQLREHIGDIDIDNPAHVDNIIEKYKSMSSGDEAESGSSARLVNMALLEDRQLATRRIEMLKRERDGLIDILRAGFESVHRDSDGVENADTYCVSPITYQLIYQDEPLLALYENYTSVQLLLENGEEWGITDSSLVWSEQLGAVHTSRRNGWLPWGEFKSLRKRGNANIETCVQLRCGHPSRTTLPRNEAERRIITSSLERAGEAEQRRARLMSEIQTSLSIVSMMKPLGEKSKLWIDKQPSPASTADLDLEMSTQQPFHTEVPLYALVFAIGRKLGLEYTTEQDTNDPNVSPRARKLAQAKLPSNYGENLLAVLRLALDELEIDCTLLGDFDDLRTGKAQSVRDVVAQICHHPKIAIRTGWREYKEIELLDDNLKALESLDDEPVDDWTSQWTTEQMEPLSCIVNLEQTLSLLLNSLAAGDRLKKALGTQQEHRLTQLLQQSETQLRDQAHRHPSCAITKVTLRDYCLNGGEEIFDPAAQPFEATSAAAVAGDTLDSQSPSDMVNDAAEEVRKAELRAAYLAWDVATVDYDALLENIQLDVEYKTNVTATFHGAETKRSRSGRNHVAAGVGVLHTDHGSGILVAPNRGRSKNKARRSTVQNVGTRC